MKKNSSTELKVGIFAIAVIIVLSYMTFKVGSLPLLWEKGYRLYVDFEDISGLDQQSRVKIAGVEAGVVERIRLENGKARLTLLINPDVKIYNDAVAFLRMSGLLGDSYLAISTGSPDRPVLKSGDNIVNAIPAADINMLANQMTSAASYMSELTKDLKDVFGESERTSLKHSIQNIEVLTKNLKQISIENRDPLRKLIAQLDDFTEALSRTGPGILDDISNVAKHFNEHGPELVTNLNDAAYELKQIIGENRDAFKDSMENIKSISKSASVITGKLERGEGTLGKLLKEDKLYDSLDKVASEAGKSLDVVGRLRTYMDFHAEYNTQESDWKGYFDLTLKPRDDKYYILGVVSDPRGSVETTKTTINGTTFTEDKVETDIEFSAQFVKRFDDLALRIGLMENTFGFGADLFFNDDLGRVKVDLWDFSGDEADADQAHIKIGVDYRVFKYIFVSGGIDNLLNSNRRGIYIGGGMQFEDEDFKYLFGSGPSLSLP
jgi:phospholipid/cholesterol/gamma-HCH transport system substrate-binding protein